MTLLSQVVGSSTKTSSLPLYQQLQRALRRGHRGRVLGAG